jgi:2-hydroxychromene-2-carboxylate isomerase
MYPIDVYFDPISPYAWLASRQIGRLDAVGARLEFKPVLFAALLDAHGTVGPAEVAAKRAHTMRDVMRAAARLGLPFEGPPTHPFNPLRALRMCIAVDEPTARRRLVLALMDAPWARGLDLADETVLIEIADTCGLDGAALLQRASEPDIKQRLVDATRAAIDAGIFGVPTFVVAGEIFWGADRIDALLWRLQGHRIDEAQLARVLARPASAIRRAL